MAFDPQAILNRLNTNDHVDHCYSGKTDFYEPCTCPPGKGEPKPYELEKWLREALTILINQHGNH